MSSESARVLIRLAGRLRRALARSADLRRALRDRRELLSYERHDGGCLASGVGRHGPQLTPHPSRRWGSGRVGPGPAGWSPQRALDDETAAQSADQVHASVDALAEGWHARSATLRLTDMPEFCAGAEQPHAQATPFKFRSSRDGTGPAVRHRPARHRRDALRRLRPPGRDAGRQTLGSVRPGPGPGPGPTSASTAATGLGETLRLDAP